MSTLVAPPKSAKATLCITFALIFLCGAATGALMMNMKTHSSREVVRGGFDGHIEAQRLRKDLELSDEQSRQLSMILDDVAKYYDNVLSDGQTRVMQILDEKQKAKFKQLLATEGH